jgi:hypothetical protein
MQLYRHAAQPELIAAGSRFTIGRDAQRKRASAPPAAPAPRQPRVSPGSSGVDAAFMSFHVHGRGIHIV